jgi:hypothetical protein
MLGCPAGKRLQTGSIHDFQISAFTSKVTMRRTVRVTRSSSRSAQLPAPKK